MPLETTHAHDRHGRSTQADEPADSGTTSSTPLWRTHDNETPDMNARARHVTDHRGDRWLVTAERRCASASASELPLSERRRALGGERKKRDGASARGRNAQPCSKAGSARRDQREGVAEASAAVRCCGEGAVIVAAGGRHTLAQGRASTGRLARRGRLRDTAGVLDVD